MSERLHIQSLVLHDSLKVDVNFDKICYSDLDKTFYLLNRQDNTVRIYKNGTLLNVIGKSGFGEENFRKLSDIYLENYLYTLDCFDKSIKKFDSNGRFIGKIALNQLGSPERFVITPYNGIYIFDGHTREIIVLDHFELTTKFSFGRFHLDSVDIMFVSRDYLYVYDRENDTTSCFLLNGKYENTYEGLTFCIGYDNLITITKGIISELKTERMLYSSNTHQQIENFLFASEREIIFSQARQIIVLKAFYENNLYFRFSQIEE